MYIVNPTQEELFLCNSNEGYEVSIELSNENYERLIKGLEEGKKYKIKDINASEFNKLFEEVEVTNEH